MSDYFRQNKINHGFSINDSWIILSSTERNIISKIELYGIPLKDWDISINYGIKTGLNEAFIITESKKNELLKEDPKSAEIIRPILRGRDIKRYSYDYANLYIITTFPSLKIDIEEYPAVKQHLIRFGIDRLKQTGDKNARKKTNNKWFEVQDSISYWEDFYRLKIMYPNMTKFLPFYLDDKGFTQNDKSFMITGSKLYFLTAFFNSSLFKYCFIDSFPELQGGTRELRKIFFDKIPVIQVSQETDDMFKPIIEKIQTLRMVNEDSKELEIFLDEKIFDLYKLNTEERQQIGFIEIQ